MIKLFVCDLSHCLSLWVELGQRDLALGALDLITHDDSGCGRCGGGGLIVFVLARGGLFLVERRDCETKNRKQGCFIYIGVQSL